VPVRQVPVTFSPVNITKKLISFVWSVWRKFAFILFSY
jgi:hypothetical protein